MTVGHNVQSTLGGDFFSFFGYQSCLIGSHLDSDIDNFVGTGKLQVEFRADRFSQDMDIAILDVTAIFSQMNRNTVSTCELGQNGGRNRIWLLTTSRLTQGGHMINIHS